MKILYSAGDRKGAAIQAVRCYHHLSKNHEVRITAYSSASSIIPNIHWLVDPLKNNKNTGKKSKEFLGEQRASFINIQSAEYILDDISLWSPDLVICDADKYIAQLSTVLGLRIWYCSPLLFEIGYNWKYGEKKFIAPMEATKKTLLRLPKGEKYLIYSPFCDLKKSFDLKEGFEWVAPYYEECSGGKIYGDTNSIADCLYTEKEFNFELNPNDSEILLNYNIKMINNLEVSINNNKTLDEFLSMLPK